MELIVKVTNEELYNEKVIDVDLTGLSCSMTGTIEIDTEDNGRMVFTGEHGATDYEDEYGFMIIERHWEEIDATEGCITRYMEDGFNFLLEVDGRHLYAIKSKNTEEWDYAANEIAKSHGLERHDHSSDVFFGCSIEEGVEIFCQ